MKKIKLLTVFATAVGLFLLANVASAINLPTFMEFDLDNWTRLYRDGEIVPACEPPCVPPPEGFPLPGDMSRAFITFNDIAPTVSGFPPVPDPGGGDSPAVWVGGVTDGTYLHGWEDNVVVFGVTPDGAGGINIYFTHADDTSWEFEVYQTGISYAEFTAGPGYLVEGPTQFDTIANNLATNASSNPFVRGRFSDSVYYDAYLASIGYDEGYGVGYVTAVAVINAGAAGVVGGDWVNQLTTPYGLGVNAFVDVDPTWGIGAMFDEDFYGSCLMLPGGLWCNNDEYDLAIQNVRLNSELGNIATNDGQFWIISDDGVRAASTIPEPATMLLLGTGLVGLSGAARRRKKKQA